MRNAVDNLSVPVWMRRVLLAAAAYNLAWAVFMIAWPAGLFRLAAMPAQGPVALALTQGCGLLVGLMGLGYAIGSRDPARHRAVILLGLTAKVLGPFGTARAVMDGVLSAEFLLLAVPNDVIWWVPLGLIVWRARERSLPAGWI